jgi:hypothetical protein
MDASGQSQQFTAIEPAPSGAGFVFLRQNRGFAVPLIALN